MSATKFLCIIIAAFLTQYQIGGQDRGCIPKEYGYEHIVCVCNASYCDNIKPIEKLLFLFYWTITSTKSGQRFAKVSQSFINSDTFNNTSDIAFTLNYNQELQTIIGFGGAFTDSASINIVNLTSGARENLLKSYFSSDGLEYTIGRIPIGGTDFSPRLYTYDDNDNEDFNLTHFQLQPEDLLYKIPVIQQALQMSKRPIKLFASPWSAPAWMKTNNNLLGKGTLKGVPGEQYYQAWADYFVKFLNEYRNHNITFWGLTTQNEPQNGNILDFDFNCMGLTEETESIFIGKNLGPTLAKHGYGDLKIMMMDDQLLMLPQWAKGVLRNDSDAKNYVAGIAFHWYLNFFVPATLLTKTHDLFPNLFLLATEACEGSQPFQKRVNIGDWIRGENYANDIINDLNHWTSGWVDWNICLSLTGGPKWSQGADDSPILVNETSDEFYKQPMYYALGHFSKFILPGSTVISTTVTKKDEDISHIAVYNSEERSTVIVILNRSDDSKKCAITDPRRGIINATLPPRSIQTFVYWDA